MGERIAGDDLSDECLHRITILGDRFHETINDNFVIAFERTSERVAQQLLRQVPGNFAFACDDDGLQFLGR